MELFVATTNPGKIADFAHAARQAGEFQIGVLPNLKVIPEPVEDAETFEGNARLKAVHYSNHAPGLWVLCDDSGLEVDALDGRPGVRSARFSRDVGAFDSAAGLDASNNNALLLAMLEQTDRTAHFRCSLALARDGAVHQTSFGVLSGELLTEAEGDGGFGYDPLFFVPELGRTLAQATPEERLRLSHRGRALCVMLEHLVDRPDRISDSLYDKRPGRPTPH